MVGKYSLNDYHFGSVLFCWHPSAQVTLITFVWLLLHRVFSNVSSNHLHERMHSHIDCICLTFLHCVFSNVSLNYMPEKRQSHIGCICLAFLHCAFSNVPSN